MAAAAAPLTPSGGVEASPRTLAARVLTDLLAPAPPAEDAGLHFRRRKGASASFAGLPITKGGCAVPTAMHADAMYAHQVSHHLRHLQPQSQHTSATTKPHPTCPGDGQGESRRRVFCCDPSCA